MIAYVDDIVVACKSLEKITEFKTRIATQFEAKDMGKLTSILGVEINYSREKGTLTISQEAYINRVLQHLGFNDSNPAGSPSQPGLKLSNKGNEFDNTAFRQAVESLMYCMLLNRPESAYPVSEVSRFVEKLT